MRILFLLHDWLPEHVGGTEVHTLELARELARLGHEPTILCTERDQARADGDLLRREHQGIPVIEVAHAREYACAEEMWGEPRQAAVFRRILRTVRPDVLHVEHFAAWGTGVLALAREAGVPAFVTLHDFHLLCARGTLLRDDGSLCAGDCSQCLESLPPPRAGAGPGPWAAAAEARREQHREDLRSASAVISPSRFLARLMEQRGMVREGSVHVLDSGLVGEWREPRVSDPRTPVRVGYVGGLYPSKGVHVLVEALARLAPGLATLDVHGVLEWFPDYVARLRNSAAGRVEVQWHGRFAPEQLDRILDGLDLLVLPSLWPENRPLTLQAAFRRGVAVLAADLGGMRELCDAGRYGRLFPRGDPAALAREIEGLARDRARLFEVACARPRLASIGEVAQAHLALYGAARTSLPSESP
jgi:glycosyltransferase involved in cell wall biosynthesis